MEYDACEITTEGMVVDCCHQLQRGVRLGLKGRV
ncbi:hypothetical protein TorRG33x02_267890 [Trema orientale]|uniref:Uncharacterized protein n=1 Tax=Trema orientale TaxID=63057 RepID=A0A2P5CZH4_TREOI|nr:hypothetical protein TorRG33x02_267890 [Trema orientale]